MTGRGPFIVAAASIFATIVTGAVCAVLASTGSATTGAEAIAMAAVAAGSLLLIAVACVLARHARPRA